MITIQVTEDFKETTTREYPTLGDAILDFEKYVDHGFAAWSRRIDLMKDDERIATKWFKPKYTPQITVRQAVVRIRELFGMEAVDRYLDLHEPMIPWESCMDCDMITPRDLTTKECLFRESHE